MTRIDLRVNELLRTGDTIITRNGARLVLGLSDGSQAVIAEKTTVEIRDLSHSSTRTIFRVLRGRTRVRIERVGGRPNPYRVNTPTAVIAVRGTIFDVLVKENETRVFVHEGQVAVSSLFAPNQEILLSAGQRTRVVTGKLPENPTTFRPGRNDDMFKSPPIRRPDPSVPGAADRVLSGDRFPAGNIPARGSGNRPSGNVPSGPPASGRRP
ncbi:MAG TPA: FecR family protein [Pyrinomonadaceae bacterium]|nr:FecR family protein [Pyrinomonadaceae bacterium]